MGDEAAGVADGVGACGAGGCGAMVGALRERNGSVGPEPCGGRIEMARVVVL